MHACMRCDKPAVCISQTCILTCRVNGKGLQIGKDVNSLENSNNFSQQISIDWDI